MSKKSRERRKARAEGKSPPQPPSPEMIQAIKRRRNRRFVFVGLIGISIPILELIGYRYRAITISVINQTREPLTKLKVNYGGGSFDASELKPRETLSRVIRPEFSFQKDQFLTYPLSIRFSTEVGSNSQIGRTGSLDFSATEVYTVVNTPIEGIQIQHTTRPGFPLSLVRELMERLGLR